MAPTVIECSAKSIVNKIMVMARSGCGGIQVGLVEISIKNLLAVFYRQVI